MKNKAPLIRFILISILSALLAYVGQPFVHENEKAIDLIINVFSILSGFLIAIMTLFTDMKFDEDANWRQLKLQENLQEQRYTKHSFLFYVYLCVLVFVFLVVLLNNNKEYANGTLIKFFEFLYLCIAAGAFIYSAFLPSKLMKNRKEKLDKLMKKKAPQSEMNREKH